MTGKKKKEEVTLQSLGRKVDGVLEMLGSFVQSTEKRFSSLNTRIDGIDERLTLIDRRVAKVEVTVLDIQDDVRGALHAIDKDSEAILNHERRVRRLEKVR